MLFLRRFTFRPYKQLINIVKMSSQAHPVHSTAQPPAAKLVKPKKDKKGGNVGPLELNPPPEFFQERIDIYEEWKAKYSQFVASQCSCVE